MMGLLGMVSSVDVLQDNNTLPARKNVWVTFAQLIRFIKENSGCLKEKETAYSKWLLQHQEKQKFLVLTVVRLLSKLMQSLERGSATLLFHQCHEQMT